jgi:hypothetical protein
VIELAKVKDKMSVKFATYQNLNERIDRLTVPQQLRLRLDARLSSPIHKNTFLSHSSKDVQYLPAIISILEEHGASVYCDLEDDRLPKNPNPKTAAIIKDQIRKCKRLVVFTTKNSKDSKWVPWELGIGDIELSSDNVALFPAASVPTDQVWARQEYLGLYRHIVWGGLEGHSGNIWMVYDHFTNTAVSLKNWCL